MQNDILARANLKFLIFYDMKMKPEGDVFDTFELIKDIGSNWDDLKHK